MHIISALNEYWPVIICYSLFLAIIFWGLVLFRAVRFNVIPNWLSWWSPLKVNIPAFARNYDYCQSDKFRIDGISYIILGASLFLWLLFLHLFCFFLQGIDEGWVHSYTILSLLLICKSGAYLKVYTLKKLNLLKSK